MLAGDVRAIGAVRRSSATSSEGAGRIISATCTASLPCRINPSPVHTCGIWTSYGGATHISAGARARPRIGELVQWFAVSTQPGRSSVPEHARTLWWYTATVPGLAAAETELPFTIASRSWTRPASPSSAAHPAASTVSGSMTNETRLRELMQA